MDRDNPFTFDTGIGGPESEPANNDAKSDSTVAGIQGRIDPAIARATIGDESAPTGAGDFTGTATGDPAGHSPGPAPGDTPRRGRGRPRKDSTSEGGEARNIRVSFIEKTLMAIHLGISAISKCPELALEEDDAKKLAEAAKPVLELYSVRLTKKQEAYGLLIEAAATVYPPMIVSLYLRKKMEAEERRKRTPVDVTPKPTPTPRDNVQNNGGGFDTTQIHIPQ